MYCKNTPNAQEYSSNRFLKLKNGYRLAARPNSVTAALQVTLDGRHIGFPTGTSVGCDATVLQSSPAIVKF